MDQKIQNIEPNYKKIYSDILNRDFPHKIEKCKTLLQKKKLSSLDILELNWKIFGTSDKETETFNQKHRSYDKATIKHILNYQRKHQLNNSQLAFHFKLSRNSVAKWKKLFS
ncbi:helix-turn-helix domain-containing protein [Epilithonimonas xixisoli]|uniref:Uncharacterized protein n=1 Tax=Epilithonimonas xixisoli TaxID=1476462 RepID=A0A4R8IA91_9FLAO|nr:helix-turn-helix domain-containing protein [Epilithonimonas xixisoli]TDX86937.1 hypothetical protein B0I22_1100 [Epilithonimonas xixisoli]